ncbi:hypothetical protein ACH5RR_004450 [Cinchona calisaya]|uniref:SAM domain-containing protein n=1 Tax=Cinchona calisaya TaxID=153742 RepID=A0ABD3AXP4_9GENT
MKYPSSKPGIEEYVHAKTSRNSLSRFKSVAFSSLGSAFSYEGWERDIISPQMNFLQFVYSVLPMAKQKQQKLVPVPATAGKKKRLSPREVGFLSADDWVVVKKQKITILIPPLPVTEQFTVLNAEESQSQVSLRETMNTHSECSDKTYSQKHSVSQGKKSWSLDPQSAIPTGKIAHPPQSTLLFPKLSNPRCSISYENPQISNIRGRKSADLFSAVKVIRKPALVFGDGMPLLNQRMRDINIEKKLLRAGGLSSWLVSLGLERFVKIFQQKNVNKFQLANLTMKKLKDMGADAVGPPEKADARY